MVETAVTGGAAAGNNIDPAELMSLFRTSQGQVQASMGDLDAALRAAAGAAGAASGGANLEAQGQIAVNNAEFANRVKKQRDDAAAAAAVGMTPGAPSDLVVTTLQQYQQTEAQLNEQGAMIREKQNESFLDNPLQWFTNQFSLPFDIAAYNSGVSNQDRRLEFLAGLSRSFQQQAQVNATVDVATDESLLAGMNKIALGKAQAAAASSQMALAQMGLSVVNMRVVMTDKVYDNALRLSDLNERQADRIFRQHQDARADQQLDIEKARLKMQSTDFETKQKGIAEFQLLLDRVTGMFNMDRVTVEMFNTNPAAQKILMPLLSNPALLTGRYGDTPAAALNTTVNMPLPPGNDITRNILVSEQNRLITSKGPTWKGLGEESQNAQLDAALTAKAVGERNNIPITGGMYSAPPIKAVLTMAGLVNEEKTGYRQTLLNDLVPLAQANPDAAFNPDDLMAAAIKRINAGTATVDQMATEISQIYKAIGIDNTGQRGYARFKLPLLLASNGGFKQEITIPYAVGNLRETVNLMDPVALVNAFVKIQARTRLRQGGSGIDLRSQSPANLPTFDTP